MLELTMTKKGWDGNNRNGDNMRARSRSRERVALLGASNGDRAQPLIQRRAATKDGEMVSLLSPGKSKRPGGGNYKRRSRGRKGRPQRWTRWRVMKYASLMIITAVLTHRLFRRQPRIVDWDKFNKILEPRASDDTRCFEESSKDTGQACSCPKHPEQPLDRSGDKDEKMWKSNHERMVSQAQNAPKDLDIVFFGDGLVEQLSGSRDLGLEMVDGMEEYFDKTFNRKNGGKFNALALGSSGDTGPNLLWHWENGIKQANLRPKLWFITVGGNDLYVHKCNDKFVRANILNVARRIFEDDPDAKIVVHGIIPRKDKLDSKKNDLGHLWNRAQGVNLDVRKWIKTHSSRVFYLNVGQTLMATGGMKGRGKVNKRYIDGIYPTPLGMKKWADLAVKKLVPILKGFDMAAHKKNAKEEDAKDPHEKQYELAKKEKEGTSNNR